MVASQQLAATWAVEAARAEDIADDLVKARELMQQFAGWRVFSSRNNKVRLASRTGGQRCPSGDDDTWAATLMADGANGWRDLESQLAEQTAHDAELAAA